MANKMALATCLVLLISCIYLTSAVNIDGVCTIAADGTDDCSVTNSKCVKTGFSECTKGHCKCKDNYNADGTTTTCKPEKAVGATCVVATDKCLGGSTCTGSQLACACSAGQTYSANIKMCKTTTEKLVGEVCTANTECYMNSVNTECVANTGTTTPKYCRCKSGYIAETTDTCRKPTVSEACTTAVGCHTDQAPSDSSHLLSTCAGSVCTCPTGSAKSSMTNAGSTFTVCLSSYAGTIKANGATCAASNACSSKYCTTCPGDSSKKCVSIPNKGDMMSATAGVLLLSAALFQLNTLLF